ncbi:MAG TPA: hypothetical protein DCQ92_06170 [Verrucomicrobia subdivision 3 bacterium]|nr:hypothetical protein [Limisphaerales bacterium]
MVLGDHFHQAIPVAVAIEQPVERPLTRFFLRLQPGKVAVEIEFFGNIDGIVRVRIQQIAPSALVVTCRRIVGPGNHVVAGVMVPAGIHAPAHLQRMVAPRIETRRQIARVIRVRNGQSHFGKKGFVKTDKP